MSFDVDILIAETVQKIEQTKLGSEAIEVLWSAAKSIFAPINLTACYVGRVYLARTFPDSPFFSYWKAPEGWGENYIKKEYIKVDPQALRALRHTQPYYLSEHDIELTKEQLAMRRDAESYGLVEYLTFPVHSLPGIAGAFAFAADTAFRLTPLQHVCLEVIGRFTYEHIEDLRGVEKDIKLQGLTDRERDVLTLVAQGKTNWEIGTILDISQYSVRDHLKSVSKRLETINRTQTIVRAVQLGLILP